MPHKFAAPLRRQQAQQRRLRPFFELNYPWHVDCIASLPVNEDCGRRTVEAKLDLKRKDRPAARSA
jgi:hypothetical protein